MSNRVNMDKATARLPSDTRAWLTAHRARYRQHLALEQARFALRREATNPATEKLLVKYDFALRGEEAGVR